jgi:hypothetical protein
MIAKEGAVFRSRILLILVVMVITLYGVSLFLGGMVDTAASAATESTPTTLEPYAFLPFIASTSPLITQDVLANGSFELGWTDLPPAPGFLINQQPNGWTLTWVAPGDPIYNDSTLAQGVPESIHKHFEQLPPHERPGEPDALILEGDWTYKIFHGGAPFGAELRQTVTGLLPRSVATVTVPIQVHLHDDTDPYAAESGVWVNGQGSWVNGQSMGDRTWYYHTMTFTVPADGTAEVVVRVKTKWSAPKDFFLDDLRLEAAVAPTNANNSSPTGGPTRGR